MDIEQLEQALKGDVLLLDVRTKGEFMGGHVEGAINTPMPVSADHPVLAAHNRTDPVYVICESGGRSGRMADHLSKAGFQTLNITGGTRAWRQAGKPVSQ